MTTLTLTVRGLNGSVIPNTSFKITAGYPDETYDPEIAMTSVVTFTTDNDGEATVTLTPGIAPYFLTRAAGMVDDVIAYKFFVPIGSTSLTLGLVYVDLKTQFKLLNDKSLYSLIEAKVAMLACLEQAKVSAAAANESKETTAGYLATIETIIGEEITAHTEGVDPHGDRAYADSLVTGLWDDRGNFDASVNAYPSSGGSGTAGAVKKGDIWTVSVAGTLPTARVVEAGDTVRALVDAPGQTQANWAIQQNNIGYTPENSANKSTDGTMAANSDTLYPSQKAAKTYIDAATAAITQTVAIATAMFINRLDHFIGDEDSTCFTVTNFGNSQSWSDTDRGNITGANAWRGVAKHQVTTSSGQRRFNFGGGYGDSVAGSATATLNWVAGDKYQFLWRGAISAVPNGSNQFGLSFGFSTRGNVDGYNPSVTAGYSHALIWADESSGFWKCSSRSATGASEQTTVTAVAVAAMTEITIHVVVAATGNVEFYINNVLVATHSEGGKILAGDKLIPQLAWTNKAAIAATRYLYSDCVGYLLAFTNQAPGLAWR